MVKKTFLPKLWLALGLMGFSSLSHSAVTCWKYTTSSAFNFPNITLTVQRDTPLNSPISDLIYNPYTITVFNCTTTVSGEYANVGIATTLNFHSVINNKSIYTTSIPGVGIAIGGRAGFSGQGYVSGEPFITPRSNLYGDPNGMRVLGYTNINSRGLQFQPFIQFYKIGPTDSGIFDGKIADVKAGNDTALLPIGTFPVSLNMVRVNSVACTINTPVIQVPLSDVNVNDFTTINKTLSPKSFSLGLNCDAGAKINVKMIGAKNTDTTTDGVLQLTDAGSQATATGVGIQILYNSKPLALDNNLVLKTSAGGQETFPFTAQYYQTKSKVTGGTANSTMVLDVTYQ